MPLDLLLVNPGGRATIYQGLGTDLTAVEPPLWCRLIAGYCHDMGWAVEILDTEAENIGPERAAEIVQQRNPTLVGMIVFGHQPSASTQQMVSAGEICRAIKAAEPKRRIIIAGGHVAALPERTMHEEPVDYACTGEGPVTIEQLLRCLSESGSPKIVEGLVWRDGDLCQVNPPAPLMNVTELHGDVWNLLPMGQYRAHNWQCFDGSPRQPYASIMTSLGCPYRCNFCMINSPFVASTGGKHLYRMRDPARVVAEIDGLYRRYKVTTFKIIDEMFVLADRHVRAICEGLAALPYSRDLNIWAYARIDTIKPAQLGLLRRAGIRWLALGIESGSAHVRDGAEKSLDEFDIVTAVRAVQAAGINVLGNFIFGLPDDTFESMHETLDLAAELKCDFANFYSCMSYPGSALYAATPEADRPKAWSGYSQHSFDCTPMPTATLTSAQVLDFRDKAFHTYFESQRYRRHVLSKFGKAAFAEIERMTAYKLPRALTP